MGGAAAIEEVVDYAAGEKRLAGADIALEDGPFTVLAERQRDLLLVFEFGVDAIECDVRLRSVGIPLIGD